jgi:hypothetical protein
LTAAGLWDELGIAPSRDPKTIRRAYAARLRKLEPDRNPEAFARLRRAFEWALSRAGREDGPDPSAEPPPPGADCDAPTEDFVSLASGSHAQVDREPPAPALDPDDIRDRDLLIALDAALRQHDAKTAIALYYRAAATGALSLQGTDVIGRLLAAAVDDVTLGGVAFRHLIRTVGLDASWSRGRIDAAVRHRVLARLRAEDWYDDLLTTAQQRKGATARKRAKIARLLLGRIGRHWHPRVDKTALRSWLAQYKIHAAWLGRRIDPAWPERLERRLRRRETFWLVLYALFVGNMLIQALVLFAVGLVEGDVELWAFMVGAPLAALFLWIFLLLVQAIIRVWNPGFRGFSHIVPWRAWSARIRAIWRRSKAPETGQGDRI